MLQPPIAADPREAAQIAYWNDAAAANWTELQDRIDPIYAPLTALAIEAASPKPGQRVLDIGCGCGATVLELARCVGPQGHVLGIDVSVRMSQRARERVADAGLANAEIVVADAATYDLARADRDLLFSRFGVMFFADPVAALSNLRRAIRDGGRLECIVWRALDENPWFAVPLQAALPMLPPAQSTADPQSPGPFAFADADRVADLLRKAGWRSVKLVRHDMPLRLAAADDLTTAAEITTWMGPLARRLSSNKAGPELKAAVKRRIENALCPYAGPNGIMLTASIWLVSAKV